MIQKDGPDVPVDEEPELDEDDPGEVPTSFTTKGTGWSGREDREL